MKKCYVTALCILLATVFLATGISWGQEMKLGFVDLQEVSRKSAKAQEFTKQLTQLMETKRGHLEKLKKELVDLQEQIQKTGPMLKAEAREDMIKKISMKEVEYKLAEQDAQSAMQNKQREIEDIFARDLKNVIGKLRQQKNLTAVLNSAALFAADDALNLTDEVIKAYDSAPSTAGGGDPKQDTKKQTPPPGPAPKPKQPAAPK
jgi:outer membrane protein